MKLLGSKSAFKFLKRGAAYSVSIFVLLVYFGFYITGCENDTYFASSTFLCDNSVQGVSCEEAPLSHEDRTGVNQRSSSQNLLEKQSAADMTDFSSGRLITIRSRLDKVNILFVIDNSSSMNKEQESIANQFDDFLDTLDDWDYHIAIITTDPDNLGNFISFPNGELFLSNPKKRRSVHKKNIRYFQRTVRRPVGAYPEEGIASLNRALEKRSQRDFFRPHSLFLVIIVSDDDEAGGPHLGKSLQSDNQPETFFEKVSDLYPYSVVTVHSIIFEPGDSKSSCPNGDAPGHVYASASRPSRSIMKRYGNISSVERPYRIYLRYKLQQSARSYS